MPLNTISYASALSKKIGVHESKFEISKVMVTDSWDYPITKERQWPYLSGIRIVQNSPSAISRGMDLPIVETDGELPIVGCSKHPNKAISVGSFPRTLNGKLNTHLPARVTINGADRDAPIGVFGFYKSLTVIFEQTPTGRLMAQDLAHDTAVDVTDRVKLDGVRLTIPGKLISEIGLTAARDPIHETPGVIFKYI